MGLFSFFKEKSIEERIQKMAQNYQTKAIWEKESFDKIGKFCEDNNGYYGKNSASCTLERENKTLKLFFVREGKDVIVELGITSYHDMDMRIF